MSTADPRKDPYDRKSVSTCEARYTYRNLSARSTSLMLAVSDCIERAFVRLHPNDPAMHLIRGVRLAKKKKRVRKPYTAVDLLLLKQHSRDKDAGIEDCQAYAEARRISPTEGPETWKQFRSPALTD